MTKKPKGPRYRNLTARGGVIYYEKWTDGKRDRFSCETADWDEAAATRDLYEQRKAAQRARGGEAPRFADMAGRYLAEATRHLSGSTLEDRQRVLGKTGLLVRYFGEAKLEAIGRPELLEWWHREVEGRDRTERTGLTYLSALSGVFGYAVDLELLQGNPVDALRATLRRRRRSKRARADEEREDVIRPLEGGDLLRFVEASAQAGGARFAGGRMKLERRHGHLADLIQLDAGLRLGEAAGLRWHDVEWGRDANDATRALVIREAVARGKHDGPPKSGRRRRVALSRRLRTALRELWLEAGQPEGAERILTRFHPRNYRTRHFDRVCAEAKIEDRTPKDLRDTFASQLLTAGVQLGWISRQLGHADVATTARHYARWCGDDAYRRPLEVAAGEVPADLLARIVEAESPHESPHLEDFGG